MSGVSSSESRRPDFGTAEEGRGTVRLLLILLFVSVPVLGGVLAFIDSVFDEQGGISGLQEPFQVAVAPSGDQIYVVAWADNALTVLEPAEGSGELSHSQTIGSLANPLGVAASPDGEHVYVASYSDSAIKIFRRLPGTGTLEYRGEVSNGVDGVFGLGGASSVAVTSDGAEVVATSWSDGALLVFSRSATTDDLVLVDVESSQWTGTANMSSAIQVVISPDNENAYVAVRSLDRIAVFSRDPSADGFAFVQDVTNGQGGVSGINEPRDIEFDATGGYVYVSGALDDSVAVFSRQPPNGELRFRRKFTQGVDGFKGLTKAYGLARVGNALLVGGYAEYAVAVLQIDPTSGLLSFVGTARDGIDGVVGLGGPSHIVSNPIRNQVYVIGVWDNSVVSFGISEVVFADGVEQGHIGGWSDMVSP